jgi:hypothetical protein
MTTEKIKGSVSRTNNALEALSKSLQESVVKEPSKMIVSPDPAPPKPAKPSVEELKVHADVDTNLIAPPHELELEPMAAAKDAENADHEHPTDKTLSPHVNVQDLIAKSGEIQPGQTIKFD